MLSETALKNAGVNVEQGVERFAGKSALYEKYLLKFPDDKAFAAIRPALDARDYELARTNTHALKGLAGNLSMNELYKLTVELLSAIKEQRTGELDALYSAVAESYAKVVDAIGKSR